MCTSKRKVSILTCLFVRSFAFTFQVVGCSLSILFFSFSLSPPSACPPSSFHKKKSAVAVVTNNVHTKEKELVNGINFCLI